MCTWTIISFTYFEFLGTCKTKLRFDADLGALGSDVHCTRYIHIEGSVELLSRNSGSTFT
jgi:hypothetical protein